MKTTTTLLAITWLVATLGHAQDEPTKERQRFQGAWTFITVELNGKNLDDLFKDARVAVKGDRVTLTFAKGGKLVRTFKVFTDTNPRCVDFLPEDGKGEGSEGIYEFKDGRLKVLVNINAGARERPVDFAAKTKNGHIFYILKRDE